MRRTASFHEFNKIEEASDEDQEEDTEKEKQVKEKRRQKEQFRLRQQMRQVNAGQAHADAKNYLVLGSVRNGAHDEEFFRVFAQYLDETIQKLKEQAPDSEDNQHGEENGHGEEE